MNAFSIAQSAAQSARPMAPPAPQSPRPTAPPAPPAPQSPRPTAPPAAQPLDVAAQIFAALKDHDVSIVDRAGHPDIFADFVAVGQFHGTTAVRRFFSDLFAAFPDFDITVTDMLSDDAYAVVRWDASGTFRGAPFQGIHSTGLRADVRGCDVMRFEDGKLRHNTIFYDGLGFARQTGVLPKQRSIMDRVMTAALNAKTDITKGIRRLLNGATA